MNRTEAISVLHEVIDKLGTCILVDYLSIDPLSFNGSQVSKDPDSGGYQIRIKCDLENYSKDCLSHILEKYKLVLTEDKDYIVII